MENINKIENCMGCGTCFNVCPRKAIEMQKDTEGFYYPKIKLDKCVNCGLCISSCAVGKATYHQHEIRAVYAVYSKNDNVRKTSSSGGVFFEICKLIIENDGIVVAPLFDQEWNLKHVVITNIEQLENAKGSKYVQSQAWAAFPDIESLLKSNKIVYFAGTSCQVAGLKKYLQRDYENLITQDIVCHGVPSPGFFKKYIYELQEKAGSLVDSISFRNKSLGWENYSVVARYRDGKTQKHLAKDDPYMKLFYKNYTLRPSCYDCDFKSVLRIADITLADFWGIKHFVPEYNDDFGVGMVLCNSEKAYRIMDSLSPFICKKVVDTDQAVNTNFTISKSAPKPENRDVFFSDIEKYSVSNLCSIYTPETKKTRIKRYLRVALLWVKKKIKS